MTDTPALLPPDPSVPGRYWIKDPVEWASPEIWMWSPSSGRWHHDLGFDWSPEGFAAEGYTLASPHPIPCPAALETLHALPDAIVQAEREASADAPNDYKIVGIGAAKNAAAMLRAAVARVRGE